MVKHVPAPKLTSNVSHSFFLIGVTVSLVFTPWFFGLTGFRDRLFTETVIFCLFLLAVLIPDLKYHFIYRYTDIDHYILCSTGAIAVYGLLSSMPWESFIAFRHYMSIVLFYFFFRCLVRDSRAMWVFFWLISFITTVYSIYGVLQYRGVFPSDFWYRPDSLASRFVNGEHFAVFLLFGIFLAMSLLAANRNWFLRALLIAFLLIMGYSLILSRARMAWIAFGAGSICFAAGLRVFKIFSGRAFWLILGGVFFTAILVCGLQRELLGVIWHRVSELWSSPGTPKFYSLTYRWNLWDGSLKAVIARPMGWGLGTFQHVFPKYRVHIDRFFVDYAHNDFLQLAVDLGLPGLAAMLMFIGLYFRKAFLFLRNGEASREDKIAAIGLVSAAVSLILASLTGFALRIYAISLFFAAFLALSAYILGTKNQENNNKEAPPLFLKPSIASVTSMTLIISIFVLSVFSVRHLLAQLHFEKGLKLDRDFAWDRAEQEYKSAETLTEYDMKYLNALGKLYQKRAGLSFRGEKKDRYRASAIRVFERLTALEPLNADNHYRLAFLFEEEKKTERARQEFLKALEIEPQNALFLLEFGNFAIRRGMRPEAVQSFEKYLKVPEMVEGAEVEVSDLLKRMYRVTQDYDDLKRVIRDDWYSHGCLGRLLGENGRWDLALEELNLSLAQAAVILKGDLGYLHGVIRKPIADFLIAHGRAQDALKIYLKALQTNPGDTSAKEAYDAVLRQAAMPHSGT